MSVCVCCHGKWGPSVHAGPAASCHKFTRGCHTGCLHFLPADCCCAAFFCAACMCLCMCAVGRVRLSRVQCAGLVQRPALTPSCCLMQQANL